jgi:hypothetical protein
MSREVRKTVGSDAELGLALQWLADMLSRGLKAGPVVVRLGRPKRAEELSAKFHALCDEAAASREWLGRKLDRYQWKVLFVSGHAIATGASADVVPGLQGEFCNLRESTASMSQERMGSLLDYVEAWMGGADED